MTVLDAGSVKDSDCGISAGSNLEVLFQDGADVAVAVLCTQTRDELGTKAVKADPDLDETQQVVLPIPKQRKEDVVTKELLDDAARCAARETMMQMAADTDVREKRTTDSGEFFVTNAATAAVAGLTTELHGKMREWESKTQQ